MKETEINPNKWKHKLCSWIGKINVKISILHRAIYRFNAVLTEIPVAFFIELEQIILKFVWNHKKNPKQPKQS